jgi:hypothetical protein
VIAGIGVRGTQQQRLLEGHDGRCEPLGGNLRLAACERCIKALIG